MGAGAPRFDAAALDRLLDAALDEDRGPGDVTTEVTVPKAARSIGRLVAKGEGRLAGLGVFARTFERVDPSVSTTLLSADGDAVAKGDVVAEVRGPASSLLVGERVALNFVQRLSGIATLTARYVAAAGDTRILDTRKTGPLLRALEKDAVVAGGGENHRFGLFDAAMIKDNHLDLSGRELGELVELLHRERPGVHVTAEARTEEEALAAVRAGAEVVMLDNFAPEELARLCGVLRSEAERVGHTVEFEASGGIDLTTVGAFARTGVDRISVGALTHSAPALDLSFQMEVAT